LAVFGLASHLTTPREFSGENLRPVTFFVVLGIKPLDGQLEPVIQRRMKDEV
jgi:hypothetical protein